MREVPLGSVCVCVIVCACGGGVPDVASSSAVVRSCASVGGHLPSNVAACLAVTLQAKIGMVLALLSKWIFVCKKRESEWIIFSPMAL
jgi:hypothetical protein